ncbi:MAG: hypothetical protein RMJ48_17995 [Roseiflexaceae bacterium]|nr:hypothetical protein [Roseiflexaceae bacterium]
MHQTRRATSTNGRSYETIEKIIAPGPVTALRTVSVALVRQ